MKTVINVVWFFLILFLWGILLISTGLGYLFVAHVVVIISIKIAECFGRVVFTPKGSLMFVDPVTAITVGSSVVKTIGGLFGKDNAQDEMKRLQAQVKSYQTPDEIFKIVQASQNNASQGLDAETLNYETTQIDRGFTSGLNTMLRLGGDPNDAAALYDQKIRATLKVGSDNHAENMKNFQIYLNSLGTLAANKAAEQKSKQDIIKDQIQATAGQINESNKDIWNGVNGVIAGVSYEELKRTGKDAAPPKVNGGNEAGKNAQAAVGGMSDAQRKILASLFASQFPYGG